MFVKMSKLNGICQLCHFFLFFWSINRGVLISINSLSFFLLQNLPSKKLIKFLNSSDPKGIVGDLALETVSTAGSPQVDPST